jgi:hypothetical protein
LAGSGRKEDAPGKSLLTRSPRSIPLRGRLGAVLRLKIHRRMRLDAKKILFLSFQPFSRPFSRNIANRWSRMILKRFLASRESVVAIRQSRRVESSLIPARD